MTISLKFIGLALTAIIFNLNVYAANWEKIGTLYYDISSIKKDGNIASITAKSSPIGREGVIYFDCVEKTANAYGWEKTLYYETIPDLEKVAIRVCKRAWEVWK